MWGISQAGWIIPYAAQRTRGLAFAILVSAGGLNPHEQVSYYMNGLARSWGLSETEIADADRMHRAVALYYGGHATYRSAQDVVDQYRNTHWFHRAVTHEFWDEMTPEGRILNPAELAAAIRDRPGAFEFYTAPSTFMDYSRLYRRGLRLPTLLVYGGADELVPVERSRAVFDAALRRDRHRHDVQVFEGATHDIQTPEGRVRPDFLEFMSQWAADRFAER